MCELLELTSSIIFFPDYVVAGLLGSLQPIIASIESFQQHFSERRKTIFRKTIYKKFPSNTTINNKKLQHAAVYSLFYREATCGARTKNYLENSR